MISIEIKNGATLIIETEGDEWKMIIRDFSGQQVFRGDQHIFTSISNFIQAAIYARAEDGDKENSG